MLLTLWDESMNGIEGFLILFIKDDLLFGNGVLKFLTTKKDLSVSIEGFEFLSLENDSSSMSKFGFDGLEFLLSENDSSTTSNFGVNGL